MNLPSNDYWEARFRELEGLSHDRGALIYADIEKAYQRAIRALQKDIIHWYSAFKDGEVTYADAKKAFKTGELEAFKMELDEYIQKASQMGLSDAWKKKLEKASARYHITRLEGIMLQLQQHLEELFAEQAKLLDDGLKDLYTDNYYRTAYTLQKGFEVGHSFAMLDPSKIETVLQKPWAPDGANFSSRVWKHRDRLVNTLSQEMTQAIIRGDDFGRATKNIAEKMNVSKRAAGRLVMTESAYIASKSQLNCYQELGVDEFRFVATLDSHTSEICRDFDGRHFSIKDFKPGVTAPPLHCHCRSCTAPYFADEKSAERVARGEDGKRYYVPGDMTYADWKKAYVDRPDDTVGGVPSDKASELMKKANSLKANEVLEIGRLDRAKFKSLAEPLLSDKVVISKSQVDHIKERRVQDFEDCIGEFQSVIQKPDFIAKGDTKDTAVMIKAIGEGYLKVVIKLRINPNEDYTENAILTFMRVGKKRFKRYAKALDFLYKRED